MNQNLKKQSSVHKDNDDKNAEEPQDWVCIKCNNLNYSFRAKCNRCKKQSREDNQKELYADYYYYSHYYGFHPTSQNYTNIHFEKDNFAFQRTQTPKKKFSISESQQSIRQDDHLPSVSPLIKRYKARQQKTNKKLKKGVFGQKLFEVQNWSEYSLPLDHLSELCKDLCLVDDDQASEQFAKIVQQMIF